MDFAYGAPTPMCDGVVRVVADNPGLLTFRGTNTYLTGDKTLAVIDPGPDDETHVNAILSAANGRPITHIFITHAHRDHIDGASRLKNATGAFTCAYGRAQTPPIEAKGYINQTFVPDIRLTGGECIGGDGWQLEALHTPGHAPDHLCFALPGGVLFSGDHVMAWSTTVIAPPEGSMAAYLASLEALLARQDTLYLPGHGGRLEAPQRMVKAHLIHRRMREQEIIQLVAAGSGTVHEIAAVVYESLDTKLLPAATLSVLAHVEHLIDRGLLTCAGSLFSTHVLSPA